MWAGRPGPHLPAADDDGILPVAEGFLLDGRVQLVAPPQAARLARPPWYVARDVTPVSRSALPLRQTTVRRSWHRRTDM
jgi:hypothetical protein